MNIVIVCGRIVSEINFKFMYDRYNKENFEDKYKHTSIANCKIELLNGSMVEIYGYDEIADYMYRYLKKNKYILIEGMIKSKIKIQISCINLLN